MMADRVAIEAARVRPPFPVVAVASLRVDLLGAAQRFGKLARSWMSQSRSMSPSTYACAIFPSPGRNSAFSASGRRNASVTLGELPNRRTYRSRIPPLRATRACSDAARKCSAFGFAAWRSFAARVRRRRKHHARDGRATEHTNVGANALSVHGGILRRTRPAPHDRRGIFRAQISACKVYQLP